MRRQKKGMSIDGLTSASVAELRAPRKHARLHRVASETANQCTQLMAPGPEAVSAKKDFAGIDMGLAQPHQHNCGSAGSPASSISASLPHSAFKLLHRDA